MINRYYQYIVEINNDLKTLTSITVSLIKQFDIGNDTSIGSFDYADIIPEIIDFTYVYFKFE